MTFETGIRRTFSSISGVSQAPANTHVSQVPGVGNLMCSIRLTPQEGLLSTVQSSRLELQATLVLDGVRIPLDAEIEWLYFQPK